MIDLEKMRRAAALLIEALGDDPRREGLAETPRRLAEMYQELFSGIGQDPRAHLGVAFEGGYDEMVVVKDIPVFSMCEHHLLPFYGTAQIGYLPEGKVAGISKLPRVVDVLARRPQMQERLTAQIADTIAQVLKPKGTGVILEAEHLCMIVRGVKKPGTTVVTCATRGSFSQDPLAHARFLSLVQGRERHAL